MCIPFKEKMKQHNRWMAWFLSVFMLLSMAACASDKADPTTTPESTQKEETILDEKEAIQLEEEETEERQEDEESEDAGYELGIIDGLTFTNDFMGISCTLPEDWVYASEAEIAELNGVVLEMFEDNEEVAELMKNSTSIYDAVAYSGDGLCNFNIIAENMGLLYGVLIDEKEYAEITVEQVKSIYETAGYANVQSEITEREIFGEEHVTIYTTSTLPEAQGGMDMYQLQILKKNGNFMGVISIASFVEDRTEEIASWFF